ncbi:protein of unknown function [Pseudodesulfovibrio profundus]|uniref:Uncharacterized protein n=1 Tax=Pseudodesulfovibrio profundus TaxID=57320 RepID=A0A2C8FAH4_9BACT|nr:protein of unknown function [Pseudodesulfovibrio profundus]
MSKSHTDYQLFPICPQFKFFNSYSLDAV